MAKLDSTKFYKPDDLAKLTVLNEDMQYALLFWASHFVKGFQVKTKALPMLQCLHQFCISVLPLYLEGLLLLLKLNEVFLVIESVVLAVSQYEASDEKMTILSLLNDLKFIAFNYHNELKASPLQVYNHALIGVPQETRYFFYYSHFATVHMTIGAKKNWGPVTLENFSEVMSLALSPDSKIIASGLSNYLVRLWSFETGECIQILGDILIWYFL
ncbi:hypothetical protein BCR33DRAFT_825041 [Rhizoclosmatium globosum]|uniref:Uncharacterized protein n=1 Tax=Rhizoclosmatium globosum TaxID=329046 RepID=A0A1Y2C5B0_9FUNG|nr:hypothetical protein BCR33DRAFT_825041 [Rhizoclosmatium globosum]|eukprot:ORY42064.1 hypothetical protein BCR33DRAFT_825041 [Rhizoclosmatium globosum]